VRELTEATEYYGRVLGFVGAVPIGTTSALVRGHGVALHLQEAPDGDGEVRVDRAGPDAVILVDHPERVRRRWDDAGASMLEPQDCPWPGGHLFGARDPDGNILTVAPAGGMSAALRRQVYGRIDDLTIRRHERMRAREEAPHLAGFREFYESLPDKQNIFYLFFSGRLLQWVARCASFVPAEVNLVLLGSDLPEEEQAWVRDHLNRPFHHVPLRIDDQIAWDFLFTVNRHNFGWIDSDCMVLDDRLFADLADLAPDTSMNCVWSWDGGYGFPLANTFLLFLGADAVARVRERGIAASPYAHDYRWQNLQVPGRRCYARRPTRGQLRMLRGLVPPDGSGRAVTPQGMAYFDTMVMYQLLARACGLPVRQVRALEGFGHLRGRPVQDESSDELLHVGGISKADALEETPAYFRDPQVKLLYLIAESVLLGRLADRLPPFYERRRRDVVTALGASGLTPAGGEQLLRDHLTQVRGMSDGAVNLVLYGR
jgi:hypothetical protein